MKRRNILSMMLCAALTAGMLTGCGGNRETAQKTDTVVLWAKHANFPWVDNDLLDDELSDTLTNGGVLSVIRVDGAPAVVDGVTYDAVDTSKTKSGQEREVEERLSDAHQAFSTCTAQTAGLNTLSAIQLAAKQLSGSENQTKLIVVDSGLSTEVPLDLTDIGKPLSGLDADASVQSLKDSQNLPDLSGCAVVWYGMGEAAGDQETLSAADASALEAFYTRYFEAAGANLHVSHTSVGEDELEDDVPPIPTVPVTKEENNAMSVPDETQFPESKIAFQDGTAQLIDTAAATSALQEITAQLKENTDVSVYVCGTTTNADSADKCRSLSKQRAQVVADILTRSGVSADQLHVIGFGAAGPHYTQDSADAQNAQNRAVTIIRADSENGQKIQAGTWVYA